jgi:hypothetical protein
MNKRAKMRAMSNNGTLYVGVDVHEKESQLAVFEKGGSLLMEESLPTKELAKFLSSLPGEKRVAISAEQEDDGGDHSSLHTVANSSRVVSMFQVFPLSISFS